MTAWTIKPTVLERRYGRLMRGPDGDGHDGGDAPAGDPPADAPADDGASVSLTGGATGDDGDKPADDAKPADDGADKPADDKPADDGADDEGVPESYTIAPDALPDGAEIDSKLLEEAAPTFKELGLSNKAANKLAPLALKVAERIGERQTAEFAEIRKGWANETLADPELGGKNWKATEANVARALDHFVGPNSKDEPNQFREMLNETGLGSHPVMVRAFNDIGKAMSEDMNFARGDRGAPIKVPRENLLYPDDAPKT